jgi:tRNA pseudouridine55 synthase
MPCNKQKKKLNSPLNHKTEINSSSEGFLLVNKPAGISSFKVVPLLRKITNIKKIGHAGTLDPAASGLLIFAISRSYTKQISKYQNMDKEYTGSIVIGLKTNTLDSDGVVVDESSPTNVSENLILEIFKEFSGKIQQKIPDFSAVKYSGKRSYELARANKVINNKTHIVEIYDLELLNFIKNKTITVDFRIKCSKGFYVRQFAEDIGNHAGHPSYLKNLVRTKIGQFYLKDAVDYEDLSLKTIKENIFIS